MNTNSSPGDQSNEAEGEQLVAVPVPALVAILLNKEKEKGLPLSENEVLEIRDRAACIMMPIDVVSKMAESRGYDDVDPEDIWSQWQSIKESLHEDS